MVNKKYNLEKENIWKYLIVILVIIILLDLVSLTLSKSLKSETIQIKEFQPFIKTENSTLISLKLPAVDTEGNGVSTILSVEAMPGTGRTLVDIEGLLFWADTQQSIRVARQVAGNISKQKLDNYDLIYSIEANASLIGGPSAGAALALATIFALEGEKPRQDIMITGTINHDGTIGPVSAIYEKALASKQAGSTIFLVPLLQSRDIIYETSEYCEEFGYSKICTTETKPKKLNISKEAGLKVIEVENIQDALDYFRLA